jgi:hypothetical protein
LSGYQSSSLCRFICSETCTVNGSHQKDGCGIDTLTGRYTPDLARVGRVSIKVFDQITEVLKKACEIEKNLKRE